MFGDQYIIPPFEVGLSSDRLAPCALHHWIHPGKATSITGLSIKSHPPSDLNIRKKDMSSRKPGSATYALMTQVTNQY